MLLFETKYCGVKTLEECNNVNCDIDIISKCSYRKKLRTEKSNKEFNYPVIIYLLLVISIIIYLIIK